MEAISILGRIVMYVLLGVMSGDGSTPVQRVDAAQARAASHVARPSSQTPDAGQGTRDAVQRRRVCQTARSLARATRLAVDVIKNLSTETAAR